jgi:hypothetical protein
MPRRPVRPPELQATRRHSTPSHAGHLVVVARRADANRGDLTGLEIVLHADGAGSFYQGAFPTSFAYGPLIYFLYSRLNLGG